VNALQLDAQGLLHRIDDLVIRLGVVVHELHLLTGDPLLREMAQAVEMLNATIRSPSPH
jgi:hypothetical protein